MNWYRNKKCILDVSKYASKFIVVGYFSCPKFIIYDCCMNFLQRRFLENMYFPGKSHLLVADVMTLLPETTFDISNIRRVGTSLLDPPEAASRLGDHSNRRCNWSFNCT